MDIKQHAIDIVKGEKNNWEDATCFVTERVAFQMRNLLRQLRKNYYGVFDKPNDPTTGREKIWVPLTESVVESIVKNIDLDTKDINIKSGNTSAIGYATLVRNKVKRMLNEMNFGETLDQMERELCINGTAVWKTIPYKEKGEKKFDIKNIDLLNIYIDPTADSIQKAYRFTERSLMTEEEVMGQKGWMETDAIEGTYNLSPTESRLNSFTSTTSHGGTKLVDVWEMWGKIPKSLITGNEDDTEEVEGHVIVSGLDAQGKERVHLIELNKKRRPYEEVWYRKIAGRWYGKGPAEQVMMMQLYQNIILNIRVNRAYVSQLGLFKIKRNAGITPQMVSRLASNGAISVNNMDDVQELVMREASSASYKDEDVANTWTQKVTQAFEAVTGESLPSNTTATTAAIQSRSANSGMSFVRKGLGLFLERWMNNQILPEMEFKQAEIIRLSGKVQELRDLDEQVIAHMLAKAVEKYNKRGIHVSVEQIAMEEERLREQVRRMGEDRFFKLSKEIDPSDYYAVVYTTNEQFDKAVEAQNIIAAMQIAPEFKAILMRELFDLMGKDARQLEEVARTLPQVAEGSPGQPIPGQQELPKNFSMPALTTAANTGQETAV